MTRLLSVFCCCLFPLLGQAETTVDFHAFVQSAYTHRESLPGVLSTVSAIRTSLAQLPGSTLKTDIRQNEGPDNLKSFLRNLPAGKTDTLSVVYIAGHQSAGAEFEFTNREKMSWARLLEGVDVPPNVRRLTILDACYSESARLSSEMFRKLGPLVVFTSAAGEKTYEMELGQRRPVDFSRRYSPELDWLKKANGQQPGQITFFGLMWSRAFLQQTPGPDRMDEWKMFMSRVQAAAEEFRRERSEKLASKIVVVNGP